MKQCKNTFPKIKFIKEAAKMYFVYYSCVVIILFSRSLYKSAFSGYSFGKLGYRLSVFFAFSACSVS